MTNYIYESKGMECPECGEKTEQLFRAKSGSGQEVMLCDACKKPKKIDYTDRGWMRGGINE